MRQLILLSSWFLLAACAEAVPAGAKNFEQVFLDLDRLEANAQECEQMKILFEENPACQRAVSQLRVFQLETKVVLKDGESDRYFDKLTHSRLLLHAALAKSLLREAGRSDNLNGTYFDPEWLERQRRD